MTPIGVIRTPYNERHRAPRQPGVAEVAEEGLIELVGGLNLEQAIEDLAGFERIWVLAWFDRAIDWRPRVLPPRGRERRSVFATRSPHRPNPISLSVFRLLELKGRTLRVADVDLLDGTPVLDIKPYVPYADAFVGSKVGWLQEIEQAAEGDDVPHYEVRWSALAQEQRSWLLQEFGLDVGQTAAAALARDPQTHPSKRIRRDSVHGPMIAEKSWRLHFSISEGSVDIVQLASGYREETLLEPDDSLVDGPAHRAFQARWGARKK